MKKRTNQLNKSSLNIFGVFEENQSYFCGFDHDHARHTPMGVPFVAFRGQLECEIAESKYSKDFC